MAEQARRTKNKTVVTVEPGKQDLLITREFDAPRELVFKAYTDAELYKQWIGPRGLKTDIQVFEMWRGGSWRFVQTGTDGKEYTFHGVNHEIVAPERLISTFEYEPLPEKGHVSMAIAEFEPLPGYRTRVREQQVFRSVEDRDGMVQSGMEEGVNEGYERLDELLERMSHTST